MSKRAHRRLVRCVVACALAGAVALGCGARTGVTDGASECRPAPLAEPLYVGAGCAFRDGSCGACEAHRAREIACGGSCVVNEAPIACTADAVTFHESGCLEHVPSGGKFDVPSVVWSPSGDWPFRACGGTKAALPACLEPVSPECRPDRVYGGGGICEQVFLYWDGSKCTWLHCSCMGPDCDVVNSKYPRGLRDCIAQHAGC
ncbi:MAG: hypothetical protein HYV09_36410 [Deltaproteobacteria bacterium]|nr:hypothetical protein [Deltaproteobacteria bacterium]